MICVVSPDGGRVKAFSLGSTIQIYTTLNFTDESRNVSVTLGVAGWAWWAWSTRLVQKSRPEFKTVNK